MTGEPSRYLYRKDISHKRWSWKGMHGTYAEGIVWRKCAKPVRDGAWNVHAVATNLQIPQPANKWWLVVPVDSPLDDHTNDWPVKLHAVTMREAVAFCIATRELL